MLDIGLCLPGESGESVLVDLQEVLFAAKARGESRRQVPPSDRADLVVKGRKLGVHAVGINQRPVFQMGVRIAASDHERQPPDKLEIGAFTDDLPDQQSALLIGDLVIF